MPTRRRPGNSKKGDRNDGADDEAPAKAKPTGREGRKASLTDRLSGLDSPLGRRSYLGLLGATASLAAVTTEVRSATTVNLGDEGLTDGDRIDPYIDQFLSDGVQVVVPQGTYRWSGDGLHRKTFNADAELVGEGMVTCEWDPSEPARTDLRADGCTFRMENFTFVGDIVTGSASDDHRINPMAGSDGVIEFVNVHMPDGNRGQSESEASAYYVGHGHDGTVRWINCSVEWFGNNGWYASSGGKDGTPGRCEWIGCFARNNNIAGIRVGSGPWLIKDTVIVNDATAPSRIDSGRRQRGIRIDEPNGPGRLENVHITVDGPSSSPPLISSDDGSGFEASADGVCIRNEGGEKAINFGKASSYSFTGQNLHLTGSGNLGYDGDWSNVCVGDGCELPETEPLDSDGSSDGSTDSGSDSGTNDGTDTSDWAVVEVLSTNDSTEFDYEFDTDGAVALDLDAGDNSAETGNDSITDNGDNTYTVSGHTGFGVGDMFRVDGTVTAFRTAAADGDYAVFVDGTEFDTGGSDSGSEDESTVDPTVVEVLSTNDATEFDYEFDADGPVTRVLDAGDRSAETSNDDITDNGDGTYTVSGHTGFGVGDTFEVEGELLAFRTAAADGDYAVFVDGTEIDTGGSDSGSDDSTDATDPTVVEVLSTNDSTEFDYEFDADGPVTRVLDAGARSAETGNDDIVDNGDGTYTVIGLVGMGYGDTFEVEGELLAFRPDTAAADCAIHVDGTDVTSDYLLPNRIVIDGTNNGPSQYSFEVTGDVTPASGTGPLEADDTVSGSAVEGEVAGDVDAYYYSGDVVDYSLSGGATVVIEDIDG